jgi:hypothetical protein
MAQGDKKKDAPSTSCVLHKPSHRQFPVWRHSLAFVTAHLTWLRLAANCGLLIAIGVDATGKRAAGPATQKAMAVV